MTTTTDAPAAPTVDHAAALKKAGEAYARKQRAADTARIALGVVIRNASAAGLGKKAIADTANVARETVYKALRGTPGVVTTPEGDVGTLAIDGVDVPGDLAIGERVTA